MTIEITFLNQNVTGPMDRTKPGDESSQFPRRRILDALSNKVSDY
jgi:hypothetical protein